MYTNKYDQSGFLEMKFDLFDWNSLLKIFPTTKCFNTQIFLNDQIYAV